MNKKILLFIGVGIIVVGLGIGGYLFLRPRCPESCDDGDSCTKESCSKATNYKCKIESIPNCCGNKTCEVGENYETCPADCPNCDDNNKCTKDTYDYHEHKCVNAPILTVVCCGNTVCEIGETHESCARDCPNCDDDNKCTKDSYNYHQQKCVNQIIIPCCGNGICDEGAETHKNCSTDCPNCDDKNKLTTDRFNYNTQKCENILTHYFIDDFEDGTTNWEFTDERGNPIVWSTMVEGGNTILKGTGYWGRLRDKEWANFIFKTKFKIIQEGDGIQFNYRIGSGAKSSNRYMIGVGSDRLYLTKSIGQKFFYNLGQSKDFPGLGKGWRTFEIRGYGDILNIYIDNKLLIKYKDTESPILSGGIALEIPENSEFLIDDVEIKVISEKDIIYP